MIPLFRRAKDRWWKKERRHLVHAHAFWHASQNC
jgi:hypothetical protein